MEITCSRVVSFARRGCGVKVTGANDDIDELRTTRGASADVDTPFRAVIEASPIPFALNDEHQNIIYLNPEFVRTFGYTQQEIPTLADWWPRAYPDPAYRTWVEAEWGKRLA